MSPDKALSIVAQICFNVPLNNADNAAMNQALQVLQEAIKPKESDDALHEHTT